MNDEPIKAEVVDDKPPPMGAQLQEESDTQALAKVTQATDGGELVVTRLFDRNPSKALAEMRAILQMMNELIEQAGRSNYISQIEGKDYPQVTWWTTVAMPLQLVPRTREMRRLDLEDEKGYKGETWLAIVDVVHLPTDKVVTTGYGICSADEKMKGHPRWNDSYAICAMAQTRGIGRCFRGPLAGLAVMAGLKPTPAEEMYKGMSGEREVKGDKPAARKVTWGDLAPAQILEGVITRIGPKDKWKREDDGKRWDKLSEEERRGKRFQKWFQSAEYPDIFFSTTSNPEAKAKAKRWEVGTLCRWQVMEDERGGAKKRESRQGRKTWQWCDVEHLRPVKVPPDEEAELAEEVAGAGDAPPGNGAEPAVAEAVAAEEGGTPRTEPPSSPPPFTKSRSVAAAHKRINIVATKVRAHPEGDVAWEEQKQGLLGSLDAFSCKDLETLNALLAWGEAFALDPTPPGEKV